MSFAWHEIREHLMNTACTLSFQRNFDFIRRTVDPIATFQDPASLLDRLHRSPGDPGGKNLILSALIRSAKGNDPVSDCALTLLLLALWPGLDAIRNRSVRRRIGSVDEITADVLARAIEEIRSLNLDRVNRIAGTILRNIERDIIRARKHETERERTACPIDPDNSPGVEGSQEDAVLVPDLVKLVGTDAALVIRVAIEGFSQTEAGIELGLSEAAARKRYQRAIYRLGKALQEID